MWLHAICDGDRYMIEYHCFGSQCSELRNKTIGHVQAILHGPNTDHMISDAQVTDDLSWEEMLYNMSTADNHPMEIEPSERMDIEPPVPTNTINPTPTRCTFNRAPDERYREPLVRNLPTDQR